MSMPFVLAGGVAMLLVAIALYSRFSLDDWLRRDESIYLYGGQQFTEGVPIYQGIFDPKTPLASMLAGAGIAIARAVGADEIHLVRLEFFAFACLTVVAVYWLAVSLWDSVLAGVVSAVTFASFKGFALDALGGPDAKTPGILFAVVSMALLVRRRWFWGSLVGTIAFLVWQPLCVYVLAAALGALITAKRGERLRQLAGVVAGAAIPLVATALYFLIAGAMPQLIETAVRFPLTGVRRGHETLQGHLDTIADVVSSDYRLTQPLFWGGLLALVALLVVRHVRGRAEGRRTLADPYVYAVMFTFVLLTAFSISDFQGYPDLYPALPYAALGVGGAAAVIVGWLGSRRSAARAATAVVLVACAALVGVSWHWYSASSRGDSVLVGERADAAAIERMLDPGETLYALGDPTMLVLTKRRNPSRFVYLGSGVARWIDRHYGGMTGWEDSIRAAHPAVVVSDDWGGSRQVVIEAWLRTEGYRLGYVGRQRLYVKPAMRARAARRGISITDTPQRPRPLARQPS